MKQNNQRLISLLISGAITLGSVAGLTACNENQAITFPATGPERTNLAVTLSLDADTHIINIVNYSLEIKDNKCYVKFFSHYDNGAKITSIGRGFTHYQYIDHKDYIVTYEISKDDYKTIATFNNNTTISIKNIPNREQIEFLQKIIDDYDPIDVKENTIDENITKKEHSY